MFKETYLAKHKDWKASERKGDHVEIVTSVARPILAPDESMVREYGRVRESQNKIQNSIVSSWWDSEYVPRYLEKIEKSLPARQRISWLQWKEHELREKDKSLWVVCYEGPKALQGTRHCHRFILLDILEGRIKL